MLDAIFDFFGSYFKEIGNEILHDLKVYFVKKAMKILEALLRRFYDAVINESDYSIDEEVYE